MTKPRLSNEDRLVAISMIEGGLSVREVARRMRCSASTISRLVQRNQETGSVRDRPRPGRQRVTTPAQDRHIRLIHLRNRFQTAVATAREIPGRNNPRISRMTVARRLHENDLHARRPFRGNMLTAERRNHSLLWAREHLRWWQRVCWSVLLTNECHFALDRPDGRRRGERYADCCVVQANRWGGGSVMMWGGISFKTQERLWCRLRATLLLSDTLTKSLRQQFFRSCKPIRKCRFSSRTMQDHTVLGLQLHDFKKTMSRSCRGQLFLLT